MIRLSEYMAGCSVVEGVLHHLQSSPAMMFKKNKILQDSPSFGPGATTQRSSLKR